MTINRLEELIVTAIKIEDEDIKKALKEDKSETNFLEPELPKGETETTIDEEEDIEAPADGAVKLEENVIYEELSEEEISINRRQFLTKALRISFGAFAGIQLISYLGFIWPKVSGGFGSKIDAGSIEEIKKAFYIGQSRGPEKSILNTDYLSTFNSIFGFHRLA